MKKCIFGGIEDIFKYRPNLTKIGPIKIKIKKKSQYTFAEGNVPEI